MTEDEATERLQRPYSPTPADMSERLNAHAVLLHYEMLNGGGQQSIRRIAAALVDVCRRLS